MLPEALSLSELALKILSSLRITKSNREKIAKLFSSLYRDLEMLVENGDRILKLLRKHNKFGHRIKRAMLSEMLKEQEVIIKRINSLLHRREVRTILSIRANQLRPLDVLIHMKKGIVTVLLERFETKRRSFFNFSPFLHIEHAERLKLPNNASIKKAKKNLHQIRSKLDELRDFIVANFEIHEVI